MTFNRAEKWAVCSVSAIFLLRMLGLFLLLPLLKAYTLELNLDSPYRLGLAMGIYGLMQSCFQIPFGFLSDKIGRQKTVSFGLWLFLLGSLCLALCKQIDVFILGRALQGMGAVGSVLMASLGDLTREAVRPYAMAMVGMSIGGAFMLSLLLGPVLYPLIGVPGLFWGMSLGATLGLWVMYQVRPLDQAHRPAQAFGLHFWQLCRDLLGNQAFLKSVFMVFATHAILAIAFLLMPGYLKQHDLPIAKQWQFYFPIALLGLGLSGLSLRRVSKQGHLAMYLNMACALLVCSVLGIVFAQNLFTMLCCFTLLFFMSFGFLEAGLPAYVTASTSAHMRGTAMGIYSSAQFLGFFAGGMLGAMLSHATFF